MTETPIIRPEVPEDYAAIAAVHAAAFDNRTTEPAVVALLRQRRGFDPDLSLVAELAGEIVGHVLFFPYTLRLLGENVPAVNLAPIGVLPGRQRQGAGSRLVEEGHRIARDKGFALSFLLGHPSYYPRFGYRTGAYGVSGVTVSAHALPAPILSSRPITGADIPTLHRLWEDDEANVDFSLDPGLDLLEWVSPNPAISSRVYERDGRIVGYTRIHKDEPARPRVFLAPDPKAARLVAASVAHAAGSPDITLPIHPSARAASAFGDVSVQRWVAAMATSLGSPVLERYFALIERDARPAGRVTWPVAFDL
ncbi:MAG TPA: N-acetyltransferase [Chloroflexota bacterium]|nr:N-acetyltransferase [Chloroflexota bacterium]